MLRHYLHLGLRLLRKQRLYAAINLIGLSIGFAIAVLIFLFVRDEFTYDNWHDNIDRIYRVDRVDFNPDGSVEGEGPWMPYPFAEALGREHPGVENTVRMFDDSVELRVGGEIAEHSVLFVDSSFFDVFGYDMLSGDPGTALVDPMSIVMTETAARRHWGTTDVLGKTIDVRFEDDYKPAVVTGVVADPPKNTNIPFEYLLPFHRTPMEYGWIANRTERWNASSFIVYAMLREGVRIDDAQATLSTLWSKFFPDRSERLRAEGAWTGEGDPATYRFLPLRAEHLATFTSGSFVPTSDPTYSWILLAIGVVILALACINFTILSVGRGATRASEIGIRKAMGAHRTQLVAQFAGESVLLSLFALVLGFGLSVLLMPSFNSLSGKSLTLGFTNDPMLLGTLVVVAVLTGLIAGWYPALYVSRHRPSDALRGRFSLGGASPITKVLVVTQFAASIVLVAGAIVMKQQLHHIQSKDLGYNPTNVLVVHSNGKDGEELANHLEQTIGSRAEVEGIAAMSFSMNRGLDQRGWNGGGKDFLSFVYRIDPDAPALLGVKLVAGRLPDPNRPSDLYRTALINEAFCQQLGYSPEEAVGKPIPGFGEGPPPPVAGNGNSNEQFDDLEAALSARRETIVLGVMKNLNFRSLRYEVEPMIMTPSDDGSMNYALVRVAGNPAGTIAALQDSWNSFAPEIPLEYTFLDEDVAMSYKDDQRWNRVMEYAAGIAILVACMGLFGLAALSVARRTKEIGVRKVLGASIGSILLLVSMDFARLVAIATLIAAPVAYLALNRWLEGFAYHITPSPIALAAAGGVVLVIALLTVAVHSMRAALADPVKALKYE